MEFFNRRLSIRKLSLSVSIGFYEIEKLRPQRVLIDVELRLPPLVNGIPDDVQATVDYDQMHKSITTLVAGRHFNLQETLCHEILALCARLDGVTGARVWVRKPDIYTDCESAGYEAEVGMAG
ncbi:dihydroneopterin aldolase [Uliginosibacterium sp. H3]|uniref:dihydroneopterin aldolase n=1 Tax=Uliginosibacterium silvisoli TaxID=3114758 RepID=A0ABU6K200_9RHOO|nr:dihydroneopterin aldolase [Uliginosibacterium sp. H3]